MYIVDIKVNGLINEFVSFRLLNQPRSEVEDSADKSGKVERPKQCKESEGP